MGESWKQVEQGCLLSARPGERKKGHDKRGIWNCKMRKYRQGLW